MSSAPCPLARVTKEKITEDQARDLAQAFADKNWNGFKVERPAGYGGGYTTMCYQTASASSARPPLAANAAAPARPLVLYSVEYSMDVKNPAGETRNLCVDQYGFITEFCGDFAMAGATGPIGPAGSMGPAGPMGAQGPAGTAGAQGQLGSVGPQAQTGAAKPWSTFRDFLFDFDKSEIRPNETKHVADIAAYMKQNPAVNVGIDGHTDPRGTDAFNQGLSERRVNAISEALVNAGVPASRIKTGAFGESQPKCSAPTEPCWQSDRRVEVLISNTQTASR
jgi:outer membrane protein OmpA-like peptidoglycan-associated protein